VSDVGLVASDAFQVVALVLSDLRPLRSIFILNYFN